jgi:hypothetical protein
MYQQVVAQQPVEAPCLWALDLAVVLVEPRLPESQQAVVAEQVDIQQPVVQAAHRDASESLAQVAVAAVAVAAIPAVAAEVVVLDCLVPEVMEQVGR